MSDILLSRVFLMVLYTRFNAKTVPNSRIVFLRGLPSNPQAGGSY